MPYCIFVCITYSDVQHFVLSRVFTFRFPCCDVCYDFHIKRMFESSLLPGVCMKSHVLVPNTIDCMSNMAVVL